MNAELPIRLEHRALVEHVLRVGVLGVLLARSTSAVSALGLALVFHLAAFALTHDVAHGALRLPRWVNEWLLALSGLLQGISGHGMRLLHQRHHARPLAPDDVEGVGARLSLWGAVRAAPKNAADYRVLAWRAANAKERRWQVGEIVANVAMAALALATHSVGAAAWVVANVLMQVSAGLWASHLSHHPPRWAKALARHLGWTHSVVLLSFGWHQEHHSHPKVLCRELNAL